MLHTGTNPGRNFCPFHSMMSCFLRKLSCLKFPFFELYPIFGKGATNNPKWPWHVQDQKYQHACYKKPKVQIFVLLLYNEPFLSYDPIFRKVHWMTPTWPSHGQGQKYNMDATYIPKCPTFNPFCCTMSHFRAAAQHWEKCTEWPQMTLTYSRPKVHKWILHTLLRFNFSPVSPTRKCAACAPF